MITSRFISRSFALALALASLAGCAGNSNAFQGAVAKRAAFDLSCSPSQTQVQSIGGNSYGAVGCGKKASYSCICAWSVMGSCTQPVCSQDGSERPPVQ